MTNSVIQSCSLDFSYPEQFAVFEDLDVQIPRGSIYGLLGPNGCGKSTLIRLLMGQGQPMAGNLSVFGLEPATDYVEIRSRIGYVPQENDLDPELTVEQTLELIASFFGGRWNQDLAKSKLQQFRLRSNLRVGLLSGGLRQCLSLVCALAVDPELLLLDEPTVGLDALVRREFAEAVIEFMAERPGRTVVISSHLLSEIEALVDHVGILTGLASHNRMLLEASLADIKEKVVIAEVDHARLPDEWQSNPKHLLKHCRGERDTLVFWADSQEEQDALKKLTQEHDGRIIHQAGLDDIFVRLFRG